MGDILESGTPLPAVGGGAGKTAPRLSWTAQTFDCSKKNSYTPPAGIMSDADAIPIPKLSHIEPNGHTFNKNLIGVFQKLNTTLDTMSKHDGVNYTLSIGSGYRSFNGQKNLWCGSCKQKYPDPMTRKTFCATPGGSRHGTGFAMDTKLLQNGKAITISGDSKAQCKTPLQNIKKIAQVFYQSDPQWNRYEAEIWHFEYGLMPPNRGKYDGLPGVCH